MLEQEHLVSKQVGAKKASERSAQNLADKLKEKGLKLPLYPTPQLIERARTVMGRIDYDPTSDPVQQVLVDATSVPAIDSNPLKEQLARQRLGSSQGCCQEYTHLVEPKPLTST